MIVSSMGPAEWDGAVRVMPRPTFSGRGAPIVAMPSGGLNRGVPTGYEGQPWVNKDWGMGDATPRSTGPALVIPLDHVRKIGLAGLAIGAGPLIGAVVGARIDIGRHGGFRDIDITGFASGAGIAGLLIGLVGGVATAAKILKS